MPIKKDKWGRSFSFVKLKNVEDEETLGFRLEDIR